MKQVVLIQPKIGYMEYLRNNIHLPLSLLNVASFIHNKYKIKIIDQRISKNWKEEIKKSLSDETICAGITSYTGPPIGYALEISKFIKSIKDIPVVWGGIHSTLLPYQTLQNPFIDFVIRGEGENSFQELLNALENGTSLDEVSGVCYKKNGEIKINQISSLLDLNKSIQPLPYHLVPVDNYISKYGGKKYFLFQSSRGCPFQCSFCYNKVFNKRKWRCLSAQNTLQQIKEVVDKYKIEDIYFVDDNFFVDLDRSREIALGLMKMGITWQAQGVDIETLLRMDDEYLDFLSKSGCRRIILGVESGSIKIRKILRKSGTIADVIKVIRKLKKYNILILCAYIIGFPGETEEDIIMTWKLMMRLFKENKNVRSPQIYLFTPYPGTELYDISVKKGFNPPSKLEEWENYNWENYNLPFFSKKMKTFMENLNFISLFLDKKEKDYPAPWLNKFLYVIYRKIAWFRFKKLFFRFMPEKFIYKKFREYLSSYRS